MLYILHVTSKDHENREYSVYRAYLRIKFGFQGLKLNQKLSNSQLL